MENKFSDGSLKMGRGLFIVLEGGDYAGKGTQIKLLHNKLFDFSEDNGILTEHEPTKDAKEIKQRLAQEEILLFGRVEIIDGNLSPKKVSERIFSFVEPLYQRIRVFI